jgi:sugar lactone lactonase YvrE
MQVFVFDLDAQEVTILGGEAPFARPFGLALDEHENVYVVEQDLRAVTVIAPDGSLQRRFSHESLVRPADVAIDRTRRLVYVADPSRQASGDHSIKVFDYAGSLLRTVGAGRGQCEGCLLFPTYVEVDGSGNLYVTSTLNSSVEVFDSEGAWIKTIGMRGNAYGMFDKPKGVAVDSFGNVYVADSGWSNVQIFNSEGEVLLYFGGRGTYPGLMRNPTGIAIDGENRIYVADYLNYRVTSYQLVNTTAEDSFLDPTRSSDTARRDR